MRTPLTCSCPCIKVTKYRKKAMLLSPTKEPALNKSMAQMRAVSVISFSLLPEERAFWREVIKLRWVLWVGLDFSTLSVMSFRMFWKNHRYITLSIIVECQCCCWWHCWITNAQAFSRLRPRWFRPYKGMWVQEYFWTGLLCPDVTPYSVYTLHIHNIHAYMYTCIPYVLYMHVHTMRACIHTYTIRKCTHARAQCGIACAHACVHACAHVCVIYKCARLGHH